MVRRIAEKLTADEAARVDAFLAASTQDTGRLDAVAAGQAVTGEDQDWLIAQLRAWDRLGRLYDCLDRSGSLLNNTCAASSADYVRWSRNPQALSPLNRPGRWVQRGLGAPRRDR
ncbi:hypothetical protein ACGFX4_28215 [Kitasatospora sp. NPDC048365]|uniref:hypothetical protein n=1 Tax=Kitasatospora sp. NPDC048365 TaxID=3364050 RepID=UPI00371B6F5E